MLVIVKLVKMAENLSRKQIAKFKEAFSLFDKKREGKILIKDVGTLIRSLGYNPTQKEIEEIIADNGKEDMIDFGQFLDIMATKCPTMDNAEEIAEAFRVFDKHHTGFIKASELRDIMLNLGEKLTQEEVNEMIREADINGDGQINYEEFINIMMN